MGAELGIWTGRIGIRIHIGAWGRGFNIGPIGGVAEKGRRSAVWAGALAALVLLLGGQAHSQAAAPRAEASILGGRAAAISELPSLAFIRSETAAGAGACTGTVVAPRVVLTAAHCAMDIETGLVDRAAGITVLTGVADLREATAANASAVAAVLINPGFKPASVHGDAALLILALPVVAAPTPLAGPADGGLYAADTPGTIAGWGRRSGKARNGADRLQVAPTAVQGAGSCESLVGRFYPFFSPGSQLCALHPPWNETGGCQGDSGGPLFATRPDGVVVQIGITSLGRGDCRTTSPGVYTRVDRVAAWVASWIAATEAGAPAPAIVLPELRLPFLSMPLGRQLVSRALAIDFGARYRRGFGKRIRCIRIEREKIKCGVSWLRGRNDYWGTITVYLAFHENSVGWNARYTIRWVDDYCWFRSGERQRCRIHTKRR